MTRISISTIMFGGALAFGSSNSLAQTFGVEYVTEWQADFKGGYDWLNLLQTSFQAPVFGSVTFEATTISTAKTGDDTLVSDLLTYSNIEAGNIPLTFARLGFGFSLGNAEFFAGVNNVNEDYFISPLTSFFTNSPCGISPTISSNYDIANYPLAAWCLHYRQQFGNVGVQTSLYPGQGFYRILGHENLFSLNIKRDGVFSISSIDYKHNGIYTVLGFAVHHGVCIGYADAEPGAQEESAPKKTLSASPWLLSEFSLPHNLGLHAHTSFSTVSDGCKAYAGVGLIYAGSHAQPGVALNYASFSSSSEYAIELTCRVPLMSDRLSLQPTLHLISTDRSSLQCVGMMRLNMAL